LTTSSKSFEDFSVGDVYRSRVGRTVSHAAEAAYARTVVLEMTRIVMIPKRTTAAGAPFLEPRG
jgi:hypothetical protein